MLLCYDSLKQTIFTASDTLTPSLRSMAVLSRARLNGEATKTSANRAQTSQSAPVSSRFLYPRPPLLGTLSKDDDNGSENVGKNEFAFFQS